MSGPLASWVGEHSRGGPVVRAVVKEYALAAGHDGRPLADVSREDLTRRTGYGRTAVAEARAEAVKLGELIELQRPGGGRGRVGRYGVVVRLHEGCPPSEAGCWSCSILAPLLRNDRQPVDSLASNGPAGGRKRPAGGPTTETETYHPQGGTSPHRESDAPAPSQGSGASEPGQQEQAGNGEVPAAIKRAWREELGLLPHQKVARALAPAPDVQRRHHSGPGLDERHSA